MKQVHFEKWSEPFRAIAELNLKTLQELSYIRPDELATLKNPQEIFEKQMKISLENGYKALEHMQKSFQIMEQALLNMVPEEMKKATSDMREAASSEMRRAANVYKTAADKTSGSKTRKRKGKTKGN